MDEPKLTRTQRDQWAEELESGRWPECFPPLLFGGFIDIATDPTGERDKAAMREIAKHVRALPVSEEEV